VLALANLQRSRKLFAEAAETYTKGLALSEKAGRADWTTYYFRGVSYERSKRWPLAEADFKRALELYPDQPLVLNYLGYSWVDQGINLDEAFRMLRKAVDLRQEDGYIVDSLGWAYYKLGRYDDAVRELERAIELKPADPVINDHLGDAYWKVGRQLEARFQWNHARDLNPEPEDLPKILRKIEVGLEDAPPKPAAEVVPARSGG
jgi:Flp pilus assembly protein TadD